MLGGSEPGRSRDPPKWERMVFRGRLRRNSFAAVKRVSVGMGRRINARTHKVQVIELAAGIQRCEFHFAGRCFPSVSQPDKVLRGWTRGRTGCEMCVLRRLSWTWMPSNSCLNYIGNVRGRVAMGLSRLLIRGGWLSGRRCSTRFSMSMMKRGDEGRDLVRRGVLMRWLMCRLGMGWYIIALLKRLKY